METADSSGTAEVAETKAPQTATAAPPSPATDAAADANAAPASKDAAREAFDRLARGESPDQVNREVYQKPAEARKPQGKGPATDGQAQPQTPPAGGKDAAAAGAPGGLESSGTAGVTPEDLQVLKRAKFDLAAWKHIPPSNRKAIVANFRATQAEADRLFQQQRGAAGTQPGHSAAEAQAITQADDGATQPHDKGPLGDPASGQPAGEQQQPPTQPARSVTSGTVAAVKGPAQGGQPQGTLNPITGQALDASQFVDQADLETLRNLGGDDLADTYSRGITRAVGSVLQQVAPALQATHFLLAEMERREWSDAVTELKKQPGYEQLGQKEETALRDKALLLIRAAGDLTNYRYREAVQDAAASLFKVNAQAAAQKQLLDRRRDSLRGSPERGTTLPAAPRALTTKERNSAIFEQLRNGLSPDDARRAVDGR